MYITGFLIVFIGAVLLIVAFIYYRRRKNPVEDISEYAYSDEW
jgi:LPXTG-motif cell wall-anchored protein